MKYLIFLLIGSIVFLVGCSEELILMNGGNSTTNLCSNNETYCEDLEYLYGTVATEDLTTVFDTRSFPSNETLYENLTSS